MTRRSIVVVSAGLGQPSSTRRLADRLADAAATALGERGVRADVEVVEVRDLAHEVVDAMLTGFAPPRLRAAQDAVAAADGLVVVTPVFNASTSGLLKSFFDALDPAALEGTPVLLGATGGSARHSLVLEHALRPLFAYLKALVVPTAVYAASEDWAGGGDGELSRRVERAGRELAAQAALHEPTAPADPFALTASFEQLLGRG